MPISFRLILVRPVQWFYFIGDGFDTFDGKRKILAILRLNFANRLKRNECRYLVRGKTDAGGQLRRERKSHIRLQECK